MFNPWSKKRIERRNHMLRVLNYLKWKEKNYEKTIDYALDVYFKEVEG